jgi:hypothetical protein
MGMVESDIEMVLNERDIKTFAVVADNNFVSLNVLDKVIQVLTLHIGLDRFAVEKGNGGNIVEIAIQAGGFYIKIDR